MDVQPQPPEKSLKHMFDATEPYHQRRRSDPTPISNRDTRKQRQAEEKKDADYVKIKRSPRAEISYFQAFKEWINL